jgi:hypothetical protein
MPGRLARAELQHAMSWIRHHSARFTACRAKGLYVQIPPYSIERPTALPPS